MKVGNSTPYKRIHSKKSNGKFRLLGMLSPRDKIAQDSYRAIFSTVLEPKFLDISTGFRENGGCFDALAQIRYWNDVKWFLEGDTTNFFDEIDHHIWETRDLWTYAGNLLKLGI